MSKLKYQKDHSLSAVIAEYLSLGIPHEKSRGVELEIAARERFPTFPLKGSGEAMLTAVKVKIDELEKVISRYECVGNWPDQVEEAVRQSIEAISIGLGILDKKQAEPEQELAALGKTLKPASRRERRNVTSTRTRLS
jgi:hypothetical protein